MNFIMNLFDNVNKIFKRYLVNSRDVQFGVMINARAQRNICRVKQAIFKRSFFKHLVDSIYGFGKLESYT